MIDRFEGIIAKALGRAAVCAIAVALALLVPASARAFPDAEIVWEFGGGPPFDFGISGTPSGFLLMSDAEAAVSYSKVLDLIDTGAYGLEAEQPFDISSDEDTDSIITSIAYISSSNEIAASQESGTLLVFSLANITSKPKFVMIEEGSSLGPIAVDSGRGILYVSDNTSRLIHVVDPLSMTVTSSITLTIGSKTSFTVTDAHYVAETDEAYFTTDGGVIFYIPVDSTAATAINVDKDNDVDLVAFDQLRNGSTLYVINDSDSEAVKIDTSSHTVDATTIDLSPNSDFSDISITQVVNPTGTYAYVAGASGVSVINTGTDEVLDFGEDAGVDGEPMPVSAQPLLIKASSVDDAFVYTIFSTGGFGVISENPFVDISSLTYSGGGSSMGQGESFTMIFASNTEGVYEVRVGGSVDASGSLLTDTEGATSGTIDADTDRAISFNYDDNADLFGEGSNTVWIFVSSGDLGGRRSAEVTVDTPPPDVVISSTGFGTGKVYVNFERIDVEDMATYNVYADTDPDAVLTKSDTSATVSQPDSGSSLTAEVTGLANSTLYYFAMEAVDASDNISPNRTSTFPDGSRVTGMPEATEGPAGASGDGGCALGGGVGAGMPWMAMIMAMIMLPLALLRRSRALLVSMILMAALLIPAVASAQPQEIEEGDVPTGWDLLKEKPPSWTAEAKTGFWMPSSDALDPFYGKCCNMWTMIQVGHLWKQKYGLEGGVGFHYKSGKAIGSTSGTTSQESYSFLLIPMEVSFVWRADYFDDWRYIIPYAKAGFDSVIFRERAAGNTTKGIKWGLHGTGGVQWNIGAAADEKSLAQVGILGMFFTTEVTYQWINNFGGKGLDLSGPVFSIGFLFYF
jgi:hypothetical protein